jgi:glycerol kinase
MPSSDTILALDQGTTSSRALLFDPNGRVLALAQHELPQHYPQSGWVEQDPREIWQDTLRAGREVLEQARGGHKPPCGIGITNQRETTILWNRESGEPLYNAIVWQDRRGEALCAKLRDEGLEPMISEKTGLLLDSYFSATKIAWLLDNVSGARARAEKGELAFGTVDSFLLWHLTGGRIHATDITNASRTLLYNISAQGWDKDLLEVFGIPESLLPEVQDNDSEFGISENSLFGTALPILGMAGDQQSAAIGQACFAPNSIKSTYGTGCFALLNTGADKQQSQNRLLSTIAYRIQGTTHYALEGSIFIAGAAVQWLRDGLGVISSAAECEDLARQADPKSEIYLVPAFTGLGAPYWDSAARGGIFGLTRASGRAELVRATLDAVCYQTRDLLEAMAADGAATPERLRVDGGMVRNDWFLQRLADITGVAVERAKTLETTAFGAACLAGLTSGIFASPQDIERNWANSGRFAPELEESSRAALYDGWKEAVGRVRR